MEALHVIQAAAWRRDLTEGAFDECEGKKGETNDSGVSSVSKEQRKILKEEILGIGSQGLSWRCLHWSNILTFQIVIVVSWLREAGAEGRVEWTAPREFADCQWLRRHRKEVQVQSEKEPEGWILTHLLQNHGSRRVSRAWKSMVSWESGKKYVSRYGSHQLALLLSKARWPANGLHDMGFTDGLMEAALGAEAWPHES